MRSRLLASNSVKELMFLASARLFWSGAVLAIPRMTLFASKNANFLTLMQIALFENNDLPSIYDVPAIPGGNRI